MIQELVIEAIKKFEDILTMEDHTKGTLLLRSNEYNAKLYLVEKGTLRSFYYVDGRDVTSHFASRHSIIGAVDSIYQGSPSIYNIEVLEDCIVYSVEYSKLEEYLTENPNLERLARKISQALYFELVERMEGLTFLSAKEKYKRLLTKNPNILQHANLGHIASFLGMTIETLSRVRGLR